MSDPKDALSAGQLRQLAALWDECGGGSAFIAALEREASRVEAEGAKLCAHDFWEWADHRGKCLKCRHCDLEKPIPAPVAGTSPPAKAEGVDAGVVQTAVPPNGLYATATPPSPDTSGDEVVREWENAIVEVFRLAGRYSIQIDRALTDARKAGDRMAQKIATLQTQAQADEDYIAAQRQTIAAAEAQHAAASKMLNEQVEISERLDRELAEARGEIERLTKAIGESCDGQRHELLLGCSRATAAEAERDTLRAMVTQLNDVLSDTLGTLHVINSKAEMCVRWGDDPNLHPVDRAKEIVALRLEAHRRIVDARKILPADLLAQHEAMKRAQKVVGEIEEAYSVYVTALADRQDGVKAGIKFLEAVETSLGSADALSTPAGKEG